VGKIRIRITLTRYQREKLFGEQYRADSGFQGTFTDYVKKKKKELKS